MTTNYPPGIDHSSAPWNEQEPLMKDCHACEGTGKDFYSCCGEDMRGRASDFCPDCLEHTGWDGLKNAEDCEECSGSGEMAMTHEEMRDDRERKKEPRDL